MLCNNTGPETFTNQDRTEDGVVWLDQAFALLRIGDHVLDFNFTHKPYLSVNVKVFHCLRVDDFRDIGVLLLPASYSLGVFSGQGDINERSQLWKNFQVSFQLKQILFSKRFRFLLFVRTSSLSFLSVTFLLQTQLLLKSLLARDVVALVDHLLGHSWPFFFIVQIAVRALVVLIIVVDLVWPEDLIKQLLMPFS